MAKHRLISPIPTDKAVEYTTNWRAFNSTNNVNSEFPIDQILANAFTFSLTDVSDLMAEQGINNVRIYFGYDTTNPEPDAERPLPMKVMLVGVNDEGKDMVDPSGEVSGIYDFAVPCPSTCDYDSPLSKNPPESQQA